MTWVALFYSGLVTLAAAWAWIVDVTMLHSQREHMLPDLVLMFVSLPASLLMEPLASLAPTVLGSPLVGLAGITLFGALQAGFLWYLARPDARARRHV